MEKLKTYGEFKSFLNILKADADYKGPTVIINAGTCGQASGANDLIRAAKREILAKGLTGKIKLRITGCHGFCQMEPSLLIEPSRTFYPKINGTDMNRIVDAILNNEIVEDLLYEDPASGKKIEKQEDIPFFKKQVRTLTSTNERVDPIRIFNYLENGGYASLCKALEKKDPQWVIDQIKSSGLRGRGGGGFPTGLKWELLAKQPGKEGKYLVCNADEGDPGAYMDRSILEGNPHVIIEGMIIGAFATGACNGIIYVRNEYPLAIKHLVIALRQARDLGLLGENILGSGFSFDISITRGAGAFVCGEETALIKSIEGKMGEPRQRPPYPVEKGIYDKPTAINNVETWANIPFIINLGAKEYAKIGTKGNSGTKIFSLVGKIRNTGLVEVPMGITIKEIVFDIGGGAVGEAKIKAVQTGGPSGGCIPVSQFDLPIDYDSLAAAGSIMGSGGMIVMDEDTCIIDVAKYFMAFLKEESCGKCFTCRKGTQRMYEILEDITEGRATMADLDLLEELAHAVQDTTMCGLGQTASNPVLSTIKYFRDEYIRHIVDKKCDAFVCTKLVGAPCQAACPIDTEAWRYIALIEQGDYEGAYRAIRETNPFPSVCARVCDHQCESHCRLGKSGDDPVAIRELKRFVTDNVNPAVYRPTYSKWPGDKVPKVAIIGSGPAGLTAAHYLSLKGVKSTVYETEPEPGGMLTCGIPAYRLNRDTLKKEIDSLLDDNITLECNKSLGRDFNVDGLFEKGFDAIFLATGAHASRALMIEGEDAEGVFSSMMFLKSLNLRGENVAKGNVGIVGGGNSALDAARVAIRQEGVESVTVFYRRTRPEMPAHEEEIDGGLSEGIELQTMVTPVQIVKSGNKLAAVKFIRNEQGEVDESGRRRPVPVKGTEFTVKLDVLIVAISESPDRRSVAEMGIEFGASDTITADEKTLETTRKGVFAGGDLVTGPNTVVKAIAAGKQAAAVMERYLLGKDLTTPPEVKLPEIYIPARPEDEESDEMIPRVWPPRLPAAIRKRNFSEVVLPFTADEANRESRRCLRCDLEFTQPEEEEESETVGVKDTQI